MRIWWQLQVCPSTHRCCSLFPGAVTPMRTAKVPAPSARYNRLLEIHDCGSPPPPSPPQPPALPPSPPSPPMPPMPPPPSSPPPPPSPPHARRRRRPPPSPSPPPPSPSPPPSRPPPSPPPPPCPSPPPPCFHASCACNVGTDSSPVHVMGLDQIWSGRLGSSNDRLTCPHGRMSTVNGVYYSSLPRCSASVVPRRPGDSGYEGICWTPPTPCTYDQMQTCCQRTSYWSTNCRRDNGIARWLVLKIDYEPPSAPPFAFLSPPPPPPLSPPLPPSTPPPPPPPAGRHAAPSLAAAFTAARARHTVNWYNYGLRYGARCYSVPSEGRVTSGPAQLAEACAPPRAAARHAGPWPTVSTSSSTGRRMANARAAAALDGRTAQVAMAGGSTDTHTTRRRRRPRPRRAPLIAACIAAGVTAILYIDQGPGDCVGQLPRRNQVTRPVTALLCQPLRARAGAPCPGITVLPSATITAAAQTTAAAKRYTSASQYQFNLPLLYGPWDDRRQRA